MLLLLFVEEDEVQLTFLLDGKRVFLIMPNAAWPKERVSVGTSSHAA
jgi:hypothetical protein